jgi:ribose transport system substrate-binding protein
MKKLLLAVTAVLALGALSGASQGQGKKTLAFVVNGASDFWKAAEAGVKKAQGELPNYNLTFKYPEQSSAAIQTRIMDDLVAAGADVGECSPADCRRRVEESFSATAMVKGYERIFESVAARS